MKEKQATKIGVSEIALRKYCIECALKSPTIVERSGGSFNAGMGGGGHDKVSDADVIGRATKILTFIRGTP